MVVVSATMNPVAGKARSFWTGTCLAALRCLVVGRCACCLGSKYVYHTGLARFSICHYAFRLCSFLKTSSFRLHNVMSIDTGEWGLPRRSCHASTMSPSSPMSSQLQYKIIIITDRLVGFVKYVLQSALFMIPIPL